MSRASREARKARARARADVRAALKARRAAVKARLAEARAAPRPEDRRRRLRRKLLLLAVLLLLLLLRRCECEEPPAPGPAPDAAVDAGIGVDAGPDAAPPTPPRATRTRRPVRARIARTERPTFENPAPPPADWLAALRIQVAARGPRLAKCFEGTDRPGALEWRAVVDVPRGVASDHAFEPVLGGAQLGRDLERCLVGVLGDPPYRLPAPDDAGQSRVSIIVEF